MILIVGLLLSTNSKKYNKRVYIPAFPLLTCQRPCHVERTRSRQLPSAPGSQATSGPVSTWMGDRLGIRDAVGTIFLLCLINHQRPYF